ncbi:MAG: response regulator transcription factor [Clostridia bacterium]|nr:response regulator transcription factor [Clostridia bacterium]
MKQKILLVEDDSFLREGLTEVLQGEGYEVISADSFLKAKEMLNFFSYNLMIFDVMLPDGNGLDLCTQLRASGSTLPVLFLTACDDEIQVVRGLDCGADDYVTKPFRLLELLSRVRALLRRNTSSVFSSGSISIDLKTMTAFKDGTALSLTPTEFLILSALIQNSGVIVTRTILLEKIWDCDESFVDDNTLSVHVSRLREKLGTNQISTVRGIGYRWEESK